MIEKDSKRNSTCFQLWNLIKNIKINLNLKKCDKNLGFNYYKRNNKNIIKHARCMYLILVAKMINQIRYNRQNYGNKWCFEKYKL